MLVGRSEDHAHPIVDHSSKRRSLHERLRLGLNRTLRGIRPERSESAGRRHERVQNAVVHSGRLRQVACDEITEHAGLCRLREVRRQAKEPAELAVRRFEVLARLIEKEEHQAGDERVAAADELDDVPWIPVDLPLVDDLRSPDPRVRDDGAYSTLADRVARVLDDEAWVLDAFLATHAFSVDASSTVRENNAKRSAFSG